MFLLFPISSGFTPWKDVGFCQRSFHASIEMVTWFLPLSVYVIDLFTFICWTIPVSLEWSPLDHRKWYVFNVFLNSEGNKEHKNRHSKKKHNVN